MTFARFMISRSAKSMVTPASTTCTDTSVIFIARRTYHWCREAAGGDQRGRRRAFPRAAAFPRSASSWRSEPCAARCGSARHRRGGPPCSRFPGSVGHPPAQGTVALVARGRDRARRCNSREDAMAEKARVKLLTESDLPYSELVPGLELARAITHAGTTQLGGGYMRFASDAEFADWTLKYDEVLFVQSGELEIISDSGSVEAHAGEAILIANGAKVTYRGRAGTIGFFVLWPFDWDKKAAAG